jgi:hypothetical protein
VPFWFPGAGPRALSQTREAHILPRHTKTAPEVFLGGGIVALCAEDPPRLRGGLSGV